MMKMPTTETQRLWTPLSLIEWSTEYLRSKQFDDPRLNVELLLAHVLRCKRIDLYLRFDQTLDENDLAKFKLLFQRRLHHEPLQYIIGETEFMGLSLSVDRRVLIPRPETELLVQQTLVGLSDAQRQYSILDIGCGSGNIAISLAHMHQQCIVDAMDSSEDAVTVATANVVRHELSQRIFIFTGDILLGTGQFIHTPYDVIVSNPPYISRKEFGTLQPEISVYEPRSATTDDADGLTFYHAIATRGRSLLKNGGLLLVEIAYDQGEAVLRIFREAGYSDVTVYKDYNKLDRIVKGRNK